MRKIIYDFGANNGDDLSYYLKKSDVVVAVEANPDLCRQITERFAEEIRAKRLIVENCVLTTKSQDAEVEFYLHKTNHVLSQLGVPTQELLQEFDRVSLPAFSVLEILRKHGDPYYIKIDLEGCDAGILRTLFANAIRPPFISAESHDIEIFSLFVASGRYDAFKLVDGPTVSTKYHSHPISVDGGTELYSFPDHSAGPFGDDIDGPWMTGQSFFRLLAFEGLGWKDIHATVARDADPQASVRMQPYAVRSLEHMLNQRFEGTSPQFLRRILLRLVGASCNMIRGF